ncbi:ABC transporter permease [Enemella sp. A6]|uniref:ABC transporter permease n=1 Tax=Enemella sp. A6 TaxID=3440152 RepID=UPI003EBCDDAE
MTTQNRPRRLPTPARVLAPLLFGAVVLGAWHLVTASGSVAPTLLPPPAEVFERFAADFASGALLRYAGITVAEALLGCLLAVVVGLPLGYLIAKARLAEAAVSPYLAASQAIPAVAIAPLLVIWVGYGLVPIMFLCAVLVFFPVVLSTVLGLRTLDPEMVEAAKLDGAHGFTMLRHIEWPLALPAVLTGLRNGFTLSVTGAVVGELVMGGNGLGMLLSVQATSIDTTGLFATLVMLSLIAVVIYLAMILIETLTDPLRPVAAERGRTATVEEPPVIAPVQPLPEPRHLSVVGRPAASRPTSSATRRYLESGVA